MRTVGERAPADGAAIIINSVSHRQVYHVVVTFTGTCYACVRWLSCKAAAQGKLSPEHTSPSSRSYACSAFSTSVDASWTLKHPVTACERAAVRLCHLSSGARTPDSTRAVAPHLRNCTLSAARKQPPKRLYPCPLQAPARAGGEAPLPHACPSTSGYSMR